MSHYNTNNQYFKYRHIKKSSVVAINLSSSLASDSDLAYSDRPTTFLPTLLNAYDYETNCIKKIKMNEILF